MSAVYGPSQAAPDASEASARPGLPASCSPQEGSSLHLHPDPLLGSAVDPQVHCGCYCIPRHGKRHLDLADETCIILQLFVVGFISKTNLLSRCRFSCYRMILIAYPLMKAIKTTAEIPEKHYSIGR